MFGLEFNPEQLDLREFCSSLIAEFQPAAPDHNDHFQQQGDCEKAAADPNLFRQAITNLLSNAVKYSPERARTILLDLVCGENEIVVRVERSRDRHSRSRSGETV